MKKITKILTCLAMCFSFSGCFSKVYNRNANNTLTITNEFQTVNDINSLVSNVELMMKKVNGVSGSYTLTNTKDTYVIEFDAITKSKRINWDLSAKTSIDDKEIKMYVKDQKLYLIYPHNGANVILKDDVKDMVVEAKDTLDKLNATYDKENFENIVMGDKLEGLDFSALKEKATYVINDDASYTLTFVDNELVWEYDITTNYLIKEVRCTAINFNSRLVLNYPNQVIVNYPKGLDFLTLDIEDVKSVLEIDSFAQLIDEDLNENK